ncbi:PD-(D/E)XK nuclease family protein [Methylacidimicrobium cyclopophantes]|nr:PD-(D/E)XK nuclease family protein [Methylacidimicrobium cyclopophantes]
MRPERTFLGWNRPLAQRAAEWLFQRGEEGAWLDLSRWLVVVPTRESGRILRGALCAQRPEGFLAPRIVTPMELFGRRSDGADMVAGWTARLWSWTQLLLSQAGRERVGAFPTLPAEPDFAWALGVARSLCEAQDLLSEGAWTFSGTQGKFPFPEEDLWNGLARLEEEYRAILEAAGLRDPMQTRLEALEKGSWVFDADRVALIGCPDPHPLALRLLERVGPEEVCSVLIEAPEGMEEGFDSWGRPDPTFWRSRRLPFPSNIRIYAQEREVAGRAAELVAANDSWDAVTIGVCSSRLLPLLRIALSERKIPAFDPGGIPARQSEWVALLADLRELVREKSLAAFRRLLCHPAAAGWLGVSEDGVSHSVLLEKLDRAALQSLSEDYRAASLEMELAPFVERARRFLFRAEEEPLEAIREIFGTIFRREASSARPLPPLDELEEGMRQVEALSASARSPFVASEYLELFEELLARQELPEERPEEAVELRGWLELLWDDAPHLVLAGFQEGAVPESVAHDFLLPATLREQLGLRTNAEREARDAYLFEALAAQRRERGRVDVLAARFSRDGEPLLPSRLLFRSAAPELPERVRRVWKTGDSPSRQQPPATDSFPIRVGPMRWEERKQLSVTGLRDYLSCPFFFYLRRVRGWEAVEWLPEELDAQAFGALLHAVLAEFGRADSMRECDRSEPIEEFLRDALSRSLRDRFPQSIPASVSLQMRALERRLSAFARAQAEEVRRGWRTIEVEEPFVFPIRDWRLHGRIDRIDRDSGGGIRLVDFKSSERPANPKSAHLCSAETGERHAAALFSWRGKLLRWKDLQLPLYAAAFREKHPELEDLRVAYFALPKDREKAGVREWKEWGRELEREAVACAARVLEAIEEGRFWPPESALEWDREPWRYWFDGRPEEIVAPVFTSE